MENSQEEFLSESYVSSEVESVKLRSRLFTINEENFKNREIQNNYQIKKLHCPNKFKSDLFKLIFFLNRKSITVENYPRELKLAKTKLLKFFRKNHSKENLI